MEECSVSAFKRSAKEVERAVRDGDLAVTDNAPPNSASELNATEPCTACASGTRLYDVQKLAHACPSFIFYVVSRANARCLVVIAKPGSLACLRVRDAPNRLSAGHERRGARGEPDGDTTDLVGAAEAAKRVGAGPLGEQVGVGVEVGGGHAGANVTGRDAVDADVLGTPLGGEVTAHLKHGRLGGVVGDPVVVAVDDRAGHRGDEDDGARNVLLLVHLARGGLGGEEDTGGVDLEDLAEFVGGVRERIVGLKDTGGSDADVERVGARVLHDKVHAGVDVVVVGNGGRDVLEVLAHDAAVVCDNLELLRGLLGQVDGVDVRTGLDVGERHLETQTAVTTGDDGGLALERELLEDGGGVVVGRVGVLAQHGVHTNVLDGRGRAGVGLDTVSSVGAGGAHAGGRPDGEDVCAKRRGGGGSLAQTQKRGLLAMRHHCMTKPVGEGVTECQRLTLSDASRKAADSAGAQSRVEGSHDGQTGIREAEGTELR
ncbi:hypothetical protein L1887_62041 [Cichorium endivia]|nr:hypothetical protein L1887_62041 [Cichorium endivia]